MAELYVDTKNYHYKQVIIPKVRENGEKFLFSHYQKIVRDNILPAVAELNNRCLLDDFYIMNHAGIDLRLAAKRWDLREKQIKEVLESHGIDGDLEDYEYKGDDLHELTPVMDAFLRFNTKLLFSYLKLEDEGFKELVISNWIPYRPAQFMHFLFNQWGYKNLEEALIYDYFSHSQFRIAYYQCHQMHHKDLRWIYFMNAKLNLKRYLNRLKIDIRVHFFQQKFYNAKWKVKRWLKRK
jgi:hypothetical protein